MKNNRYKEIVLSIIGSIIFFIFFEPLLKFVGKCVFNISNKLLKSFSNSLYTSIGQERYDIDLFIVVLLAALFIFVICLVFLKSILDIKELLDESNTFISDLNREIDANLVIDSRDIEEDAINLNKDIKRISKNIIIWGIVYGFLFIIPIFTILATQITIKDKVFLYKNTKVIVTPYIDKVNLEIIDSKFHQIQSKEDFDNVFAEINNLLKNENKQIIFKKGNIVELT